MSNKLFLVNRTLSLNGNLLEVERNFGIYTSPDLAESRAEELYDAVAKNVALKGLCINFYVKEVVANPAAAE
jgi:hypothetical protein